MAEIILALDYASGDDALDLVHALGARATFYKVGLELFTREGPGIVERLRERGKNVFLDLKLLDIPSTVAGAVAAAADLEVELLTLHTTGGTSMMTAAAEASAGRVKLLGVTILTSFPIPEVEVVWGRSLVSLRDEVLRLAEAAWESGIDGVVASPLEAEPIKKKHGDDLLVVTPGIRLRGQAVHDQNRVSTPGDASRAGADYLVVGRSVTSAPHPVEALEAVESDLALAGVDPA